MGIERFINYNISELSKTDGTEKTIKNSSNSDNPIDNSQSKNKLTVEMENQGNYGRMFFEYKNKNYFNKLKTKNH